MKLQSIEPFAQRNHGLVTVEAAERAGVSRRTFYRAVDDGRLELLYPRVARIFGTAATREQTIAAAVLAAGPGAMASHRSAAYLWGVPRPPHEPPELTLPQRSREATLPGAVVHRPRDQRDLGPARRRNIATTNILRTLCDLGAVDEPAVHDAVGHVLTNGLASALALQAAVRVHGRRGRPGVPALRAALDSWVIDGRILDSKLEVLMTRLIKRYRLPAMQFHAVILGYEVDFWIIDTPIVLECDSWEFHDKRRDRYERDRHRDLKFTAAGYITVRFTYSKLTSHPQWVATMIRAAVDRWAHRPVPAG